MEWACEESQIPFPQEYYLTTKIIKNSHLESEDLPKDAHQMETQSFKKIY